MRILVLNSGSSSIKFSMFDSGPAERSSEPRCLFDGELSEIRQPEAAFDISGVEQEFVGNLRSNVKAANSVVAIGLVLDAVCRPQMPVAEAVGYRIVHPGAKLKGHQRITEEVLRDLAEAAIFAPLHEPETIAVIRESMRRFPEIPHFACFDTTFHRTMPQAATTYAIPNEYRQQGVQRYGFHGLSCESIVRQMRAGGEEVPKRMVIAHLGSGCSVTALVDGCSVDTTMGLTPTGGVVMGTRPGDIDPGLVLYLLRQQKGDREDATSGLEAILNHKSGMVALATQGNNMKLIREAARNGDAGAQLALKVFTRSVTKAIGGFCWSMGGLDSLIFAGGIGEHDMLTRSQVLDGLEDLGVRIDASLNGANESGVRRISTSESKTAVFVVPAQEDLMIAVHVDHMARSQTPSQP